MYEKIWKYFKEFFSLNTIEYDIINETYLTNNGYKLYHLSEFINLYKNNKIKENCKCDFSPLHLNFSIRKNLYSDGCIKYEIYEYGPNFYLYKYRHTYIAKICSYAINDKWLKNKRDELYISIKKEIMDHYIRGCDCI